WYLGKEVIVPQLREDYGAYYVIHSAIDGVLKSLEYATALEPFIIERHQYIQPGEPVRSFQGSNAAIGVILLKFNTSADRDRIFNSIHSYVHVKLEQTHGK